jgi:hypothetical protein
LELSAFASQGILWGVAAVVIAALVAALSQYMLWLSTDALLGLSRAALRRVLRCATSSKANSARVAAISRQLEIEVDHLVLATSGEWWCLVGCPESKLWKLTFPAVCPAEEMDESGLPPCSLDTYPGVPGGCMIDKAARPAAGSTC